jgi:hypothetical protein
MNSDLGSLLFAGRVSPARAVRLLAPLMRRYPWGLLEPGLGVRAANSTYAGLDVQRRYKQDTYHSDDVVWGREVNLLMLGIGRLILAAYDEQGRLRDPGDARHVQELSAMFDTIHQAVERSGLRDNELWSYGVTRGRLVPRRYGKTTDVQAWNLTALAVEHMRDALHSLGVLRSNRDSNVRESPSGR